MRIALALAALAFAPLSSLHAAFTDFSDYSQTTSFAFGQVFESGDLAFKAAGSGQSSNSVAIFVSSQFNHAVLYAGPGVEFLVPPGVQEVSFDYVDGAGLGLILNGVRPLSPGENGTPFHAGFSFLDGMSLAGVEVTTATAVSTVHSERGTVTFRGPVDSLAIAGLELTIDNVSVIVPEPGAGALLLTGIAGVHGLRRRRRTRWRDVKRRLA